MYYSPLSRIRVPGLGNLVVKSKLKRPMRLRRKADSSIRHGIKYANYDDCAIDMRAVSTVSERTETAYINCSTGELGADQRTWVYEKKSHAQRAEEEAQLARTEDIVTVSVQLFCQPKLPLSREYSSVPFPLELL